MNYAFLQGLDQGARRAIPVVLALAIAVVNVVPLRLPDYASIAPGFVLMIVFYWALHRPELMTPLAVFVVGLLDDALSGAPLGLNALVLVLVHAVVAPQHKVLRGKPFELVWGAFAVVALGAKTGEALLAWLFAGVPVQGALLTLQVALTIVLYPALAWLMGRIQRGVLPQA